MRDRAIRSNLNLPRKDPFSQQHLHVWDYWFHQVSRWETIKPRQQSLKREMWFTCLDGQTDGTMSSRFVHTEWDNYSMLRFVLKRITYPMTSFMCRFNILSQRYHGNRDSLMKATWFPPSEFTSITFSAAPGFAIRTKEGLSTDLPGNL